MTPQVIKLSCPGCGARVSSGQQLCEYCGGPILISTINSVLSLSRPEANQYAGTYRKALTEDPDNRELNISIALCYLRLKLYDKAIPAFEKTIEDNVDNPETFFYLSLSLLRGKKAYLAQRSDIDKIIEYLNAAIMITPKGIYYYMLSYIKYDYFHRKYLNISPNHIEDYEMSNEMGVSEDEIQQFYSVLGIERPEVM
jgi:tetratricopeptide (TPR) repeat protein